MITAIILQLSVLKKIKLTGITNNEITTYEGAPSRSFVPSIVSGFNVFEDHITDIGTFRIASTDTNVVTVGLNNQLSFVGVGKANIVVADKDTSLYALIEVNVLPADYQSAVDNGTAVFPKIDAGDYFSIALKADGTVWTWGYNVAGQLGNNSTADSLIPVQVLGGATGNQYLTNVVQVAAGGTFDGGNRYYALALRENGTVWAWGNNEYGQLGDGSVSCAYEPINVTALNGKDIVSVHAGEYHSIALTRDGEVYTWGHNDYGQLGLGNASIVVSTPQKVESLPEIVSISAGKQHTMVLGADGYVYSFGDNSLGQLGAPSKDTSKRSSTPVVAQGLNKVISISIGAGGSATKAVRYDGTLWGWGENSNHQINNTNNRYYSYPVKIDLGDEFNGHILKRMMVYITLLQCLITAELYRGALTVKVSLDKVLTKRKLVILCS